MRSLWIASSLMLGFLSATFAYAEQADPEWLVQVGSTYNDEVTGKAQRFHGTGTIVKIGDDYFVLTASHVSQGDNVILQSGGRRLQFLKHERLSDNLADIELIRISEEDVKPFGVLAYDRLDERQSSIVGPLVDSGLEIQGLSVTPSGDHKIPQASWNLNADEWKNKAPAAKPGLGATDLTGDRYLRSTLAADEYIADVQIRPGMSGAPLIGRDSFNGYSERGKDSGGLPGSDRYVLRGIAKSYSRAFEESHFVTAEQISRLLESFNAGKRGTLDPTRWRLRNGLTYRDLGSGTQEINPLNAPAGGGGSADGGGGGSADGGGNGSADSGDSHASAADVYKQFGIEPGVIWHGTPAFALKVRHRSGNVFVVNGDLASIRFLKESRDFLAVEPVATPEEIGKLIFDKVSHADDLSELMSGMEFVSSCSIEVGKGPKDGAKISIALPGDDSLEFSLNEKGELVKPTSYPFRPIQEVLSKRERKPYRVDVTGLFAVGVGSLRGNRVTMTSSTTPHLGNILDYSKKPYLLIKADKSSRDRPIFCSTRKAKPTVQNSSAPGCLRESAPEYPVQLVNSVQGVLDKLAQ